MFAGPIIAREVLTAPRPLKFYVARASYVGLLFILMWTAWQSQVGLTDVSEMGIIAYFGHLLFRLFVLFQLSPWPIIANTTPAGGDTGAHVWGPNFLQQHLLPQGQLMHRGRPVNTKAVSRMGLMTVEGEKDDICSIGQTLAAQDLCTGVRAYRRVHHMQAGVGHYGVFSGKRWNNEIYPLLRDFVHVNS